MFRSCAGVITPIFLLASCAIPLPPELAVAQQAEFSQLEPILTPTGEMTVVDARPEQSKKTSALLSYVISDCLYGVARFGDEIVPDRLARLQRDILAAFGDEVRGKQLNVLRYELHYGATPPNPCPIVIPACQAGGKPPVDGPIYIEPKCSRQKMRVGWFDKADLERNTLPIIADVQVEFEGQTYSANAAYAPAGPLDGDADGPKFQAPGQIVVRKVNQRLIEAMRASSP